MLTFNSRLKALIKKEFLQFFRDKALVILVFYVFVEIILCGYALFLDVKNVSTTVYDLDNSPLSRELISKFAGTDNFSVKAMVSNGRELDQSLATGKATLAIVIPKDFSAAIYQRIPAKVQLLIDGTNSNTATLALSYAYTIIRDFSSLIEIDRLGLTDSQIERLPTLQSFVTSWYSSDLNFTHFNLIAMVSIAAMFIGVLLIAGAVVREKDSGTLEQLMVTPVKPYELILAKMLPMGIVKLVGVAIGVVIAVFLFDVPFRGSLMLFFALSSLLLFTAMGIGAFIAILSKNMQQALLLSFFVLFPVMFLSGTIVPISSMPLFLQWLSYLSPLRYYTDITLGIFLKGSGLTILWPQVLGLTLLGIGVFILSSIKYKQYS